MEWKCDFDHHTINRLIYRGEDKFLNSLRASFAILGVNCEPYIVQLPASAQDDATIRSNHFLYLSAHFKTNLSLILLHTH